MGLLCSDIRKSETLSIEKDINLIQLMQWRINGKFRFCRQTARVCILSLPFIGLSESCLPSLGLSFFICKMGQGTYKVGVFFFFLRTKCLRIALATHSVRVSLKLVVRKLVMSGGKTLVLFFLHILPNPIF